MNFPKTPTLTVQIDLRKSVELRLIRAVADAALQAAAVELVFLRQQDPMGRSASRASLKDLREKNAYQRRRIYPHTELSLEGEGMEDKGE